MKDLFPRVHFKVMFRIHEPYMHVVGDVSRPGRCIQEIAVLGHNSLTKLRDSIICESDFQDVRGDISDNPDLPIKERARVSLFVGYVFMNSVTLKIDCVFSVIRPLVILPRRRLTCYCTLPEG